jgi:hypothetical protein
MEFTNHMWPATKAYTVEKCQYHLGIVAKVVPNAGRNVGKVKIYRGDNDCAKISEVDSEGKVWRHTVELDKQECTYRE